jgi:PKD repeat protein
LVASFFVASFVASLAGSLTACGGGGGGGSSPPPPPPPPANQPPVASFTAAATVAAGAPLVVDAAASTDPEGDALTFSWNFGDGTRGGGRKLPHVFTSAGTYTVTLTVSDARGGSATATRAVTVSNGPTMGAAMDTVLAVTDGTAPLAGVAVSVVGGTATATTGADGRATLPTGTGAPLQLRFAKAGFADQIKSIELPVGASGGYLEVRMLAREAPLTLPSAAAGGTLAGKDGARVTFAPNSLVDANGQPVTGAVQVNVTPVNVGSNAEAFPGLFAGFREDGARGLLASYGTVEYVLTSNGQRVQLAPGASATVEIPIYTTLNLDRTTVVAGATIPLWSLDERTGVWVQEGVGTVVANPGSPSELALRAQVTHFSWWNCDAFVFPPYKPNGRCCIRDTPGGACKENSGDVCNVAGNTRENNGSNAMSSAVRPFAVNPLAVNPATRRVPMTVATAQIPALAGAVLAMPADVDIDVVATARNGTYRGTRLFRGGPDVTDNVVIDLLPTQSVGDIAISLPWDQTYALQAVGNVSRFRLPLPAGPGFEVRVSRAGSTLSGSVRLLRPDNSVVGDVPFNATSAYLAENTVAAAGEYRIEVTAGANAPGGFRLEVASIGSCGTVEALSIPSTPSVPLGQQQSRCYDMTLAADDAVRVDLTGVSNGVQGSISLSTAGGAQLLAALNYGAGAPGAGSSILTGVSVAGTYRLRVTNTTNATGSVTLALSKPAVEVLAVPATATIANLVTATPRLYLIKPPADGLFHLALTSTGGQVGAGFNPRPASFLVASSPGALAYRVDAPALPVVSVFRNSGSGTVTITTGVPTVIARDADVSGTAPAGGVSVYAFNAAAGDAIAFARAHPQSSFAVAAFSVQSPAGTALPETTPVHTLAATGLHSVVLSGLGGTPAPFTFRINNAPAPVALALTPPVTEQSINLPLGQVLRYTLDPTQGDLLGLKLTTPGSLDVNASLPGVVNVSTPTSGTGPFSATTPPAFVYTTGIATLTVRSTSSTFERAQGAATLSVVKPTPVTAAINAGINGGPLALDEWVTYRVAIPASGRYLVRLGTSAGPPFGSFTATMWAPGTPFSLGYAGEFSAVLDGSFAAADGLGLLAAAGNYTISVRRHNPMGITLPPGSVPFTVRLINLEAPVVLTPGAAATAGTIDVDGERDYANFTGVGGQTYTVRVTAAFAGTVRVRKLVGVAQDFTARTDPPFGVFNLGGTPLALTANTERAVTFTIPNDATFGNGTYIVEVAADGAATGSYTVLLTSP